MMQGDWMGSWGNGSMGMGGGILMLLVVVLIVAVVFAISQKK